VSGAPGFTGERLHAGDPLFALDLARHEVAYQIAGAALAGGRVLDLGCGSGYGAAGLAGRGAMVVGLDRVAPDRASRRSGARFVRADLGALPLRRGSFDLVVSFQVIEHLADPGPYLDAIASLLAPGGTAILTTPNVLTSDGVNPYHVHEYRAEELRQLLLSRFEEVEIQGIGASEPVRRALAARSRRIRRILRLDPLRLRERLPRAAVERLFAFFAVLVRRLAAAGEGVPAVATRDFPVGPADERCLDLLAFCRSVVDTTAPMLAAPADALAECTSPTGTPVAIGTPEVRDLCHPEVRVAHDALAVYPLGDTTVTWTAVDASGNASTDVQTVTVRDTTGPEISCNAPGVIVPPDAPIAFTATATDGCEGAASVAITGFDRFRLTGKGRRIDKTKSCKLVLAGDTLAILDAGGVGHHVEWTLVATDAHGNRTETSCNVLVVDPGRTPDPPCGIDLSSARRAGLPRRLRQVHRNLHHGPGAGRREERAQVVVADLALPAREGLEALEGGLDATLAEGEAERAHARHEAGAARELPEHDLAPARVADARRVDHLVGLAVLEDAVLVDARGVPEGVAADDRLVRRDRDPAPLLDEPRERADPGRIDAGVDAERRAVDAERHHDLLERGIAGALADPVHRDLHLAGAGGDRRERVRGGEPEVVLAVERDHGLLELGQARAQAGHQVAYLIRARVAHGVGQVDRARPGRERRAHDLGHEVGRGARRVHRAELDVVGEVARAPHHRRHHADHLLARRAELVRELHVARVDEHVDARARRAAQRLARRLDVAGHGARQGADARVAHVLRDAAHRGELLGRARREAGLDHVDAQALELLRDAQLLLPGHRRTRALLAVAERGIEDDQPFLAHGRLPSGAYVAAMRMAPHCAETNRIGGKVVC
jgi:2-polyprenyl-3-methyl-5-hydroxy-6-metoxy-1,4-benzoquinol methylase